MRFKDKVILLTGSAACDKNKIMGFGGATVWRFFEEGGRAAIITDVQEELGRMDGFVDMSKPFLVIRFSGEQLITE